MVLEILNNSKESSGSRKNEVLSCLDKKNAVSWHGCCSLAEANDRLYIYIFFFNNALQLFLSKLAAARFCGFEYVSKNLHNCS